MKRFLFIVIAFFSFQLASAQDEPEPVGVPNEAVNVSKNVINDENTIYTSTEVSPEFPGGIRKFYDYVSTNFKIPNVKGVCFVQFVIEKDGNLSNIKVLRDIGVGTEVEVVRVLKESPKWKSGIQNGRPVRFMYSIPLSIQNKNPRL